MSSQPLKIAAQLAAQPASLDQAVDRIITRFRERGRIDMGSETVRAALRDRLTHAGFEEQQMRLLEVNMLGNISAWMELALDERKKGHNVIPDFVRHLRTAFLAHCREHKISPDEAITMSIELATAIMELAGSFRRVLAIATNVPVSEDAPSSAAPESGAGNE